MKLRPEDLAGFRTLARNEKDRAPDVSWALAQTLNHVDALQDALDAAHRIIRMTRDAVSQFPEIEASQREQGPNPDNQRQ